MNYQFNRSWLLILLLLVMITPLLVQADTPTQLEALTVEQSDETTLRLTLRQPEPTVQNVIEAGRSWQQVTLDGFETSRIEGAPALPYKEFKVAIPVGAVAEVAVISAETHTLANITPLPAPEKILVSYDENDPTSVPEFEEHYALDSRAASATNAVVEISDPYNVRDYRLTTLTVRPIQTDGDGVLVYDELTVEVTFSYPNGKTVAQNLRPESEAFAGLINPINADVAQNWRTIPEFDIPAPSPCVGSNAYRINVTQSGVHKISRADLPNFTTGNAADLKMCYDDQEIAVHVVGTGAFDGSDYVLFYGESIADREKRTGITYETQDTDINRYWLTFQSGSRKRVGALATGSGGTAVTSYQHGVRMEQDGVYASSIPLDDLSEIEDDHDHWFWQIFGYNVDNFDSTVNATFALTNRVAGTPVTASAEIWGRNLNETHKVQLRIAGQSAAPTTFFGSGTAGAKTVLEATVTPSNSPTLVVGVEALDGGSGEPHSMMLGWINVAYERALQAANGRLLFSQPSAGNYAYNLSGLGNGAFVFDATDVYNPTMLTLSGRSFNPAQASTTFPATYALATSDGAITPSAGAIVKDTPSSLRGSNSADYIIITDPALQSALNPLISLRQNKGLTVKTVFVQDIFDEFGYGRYSTRAIRNFLEYAYTNWSGTAPSYVLLAGDASYDHRDVLGNNNGRNFVPVYLHSGIDKFIGETASDNQFVAFSDTMDFGRLPSMHLGRLPASSVSEMQTLVNKVVSYENAPLNVSWHGSQLFVSDNSKKRSGSNCIDDQAGDFFNITNELISQYAAPHGQLIHRLFYADCHQDDVPYPDHYEANTVALQSKFTSLVEDGQGFVTYVGHASQFRWADESIVTLAQMENLRNGNQLTIMLPMTCLEGQYHRFDFLQNGQPVDGMSETMLKNPNGGAVASYAPTGLAVATGHDFLWEGFNEQIFEEGQRIIGQAVYGAKDNLPNNTFIDLHDTFILLGDPAMQLKVWDGAGSIYLPIVLK